MIVPRARPVRIVHLDLAEPPPPLSGERGAFVVLWYHGVPLGKLDLDVSQLPRTAEQVADLIAPAISAAVYGHLFSPDAEAQDFGDHQDLDKLPDLDMLLPADQPLRLLAEALALPPGSGDAVSVVVCTRDRPDSLRRCLAALMAQRHSPLEIIVVDNAPRSSATRLTVAEFPGVRYVLEPRPGLDIARNAGITASEGETIAYTDDDVEVHADWVGRVGAAFADPAIAAVTGQVLPAVLDTGAQVLFERWWSLGRDCAPRVYGPSFLAATRHRGAPVWEIGAGANMAFRRTVLDEVGWFDERLDVGAAGCSGDSEMWYRLLAHGHRIRYDPAAVVRHRHRETPAELSRQLRGYMSGHTAALLVQWERTGDVGNLRRLAFHQPASYLRTAVDRLVGGQTPRTQTLPDEVLGAMRGVRYYLRRRVRESHHA